MWKNCSKLWIIFFWFLSLCSRKKKKLLENLTVWKMSAYPQDPSLISFPSNVSHRSDYKNKYKYKLQVRLLMSICIALAHFLIFAEASRREFKITGISRAKEWRSFFSQWPNRQTYELHRFIDARMFRCINSKGWIFTYQLFPKSKSFS